MLNVQCCKIVVKWCACIVSETCALQTVNLNENLIDNYGCLCLNQNYQEYVGTPSQEWGKLTLSEVCHLEFELLQCDWKSTTYIPIIKSTKIASFSFMNTPYSPTFLDLVFPSKWLNSGAKGMLKNLLTPQVMLCLFPLYPWHLLIVLLSICLFLQNQASLHPLFVLVF